jgi:hypothetical protein
MRRISREPGLPLGALSDDHEEYADLGTRILEQQQSGVDGLRRSDLERRSVVNP